LVLLINKKNMKKALCVASVLATLIGTANAVELKPYVGLEGSYNMVDMDKTDYEGTIETEPKNFNIGLDFGARLNLNEMFYTALEGYVNTGTLIDEKYKNTYTGSVEMNNYYGVRAEAGVNVMKDLSLFAKLGLNQISYEDKYDDTEAPMKDNTYAVSYGAGVGYMLTSSLEAKFTFEYMSPTVKDDGLKYTHDVSTYRVGLNYLF